MFITSVVKPYSVPSGVGAMPRLATMVSTESVNALTSLVWSADSEK